jgi:hypothetical protein
VLEQDTPNLYDMTISFGTHALAFCGVPVPVNNTDKGCLRLCGRRNRGFFVMDNRENFPAPPNRMDLSPSLLDFWANASEFIDRIADYQHRPDSIRLIDGEKL